MAEDPDNITLRYLRRLDEKLDRLAEQLSEITADLRSINAQCTEFFQRGAEIS